MRQGVVGWLPAGLLFFLARVWMQKQETKPSSAYVLRRSGGRRRVWPRARRDASHTGLRVWLRHAEADHPSIPSLQPVSCEHSLASSPPVLPGLPHGTVGGAAIGVGLVFLRWWWCGVEACKRRAGISSFVYYYYFFPFSCAASSRPVALRFCWCVCARLLCTRLLLFRARSARRFIFAPCYTYRAPVASVRGTKQSEEEARIVVHRRNKRRTYRQQELIRGSCLLPCIFASRLRPTRAPGSAPFKAVIGGCRARHDAA